MQVKKLPSGKEMVDFLSSTGLTYWDIARGVGCHCATILRIRDKPSVRPRRHVWEGLYKPNVSLSGYECYPGPRHPFHDGAPY